MEKEDFAAYLAKYHHIKINRRNDDNLANVMMRMLDAYGLKDKYNETRLKSLWEQVMGSAAARQTTRLAFDNGTLHVSIRSAALRQELFYLRTQIKERFNEELGYEFLRDVRLM